MKMKLLRPLFYLLTLILISSCNNNQTMNKKYNELNDKDYEHNSDTVDGETIYFNMSQWVPYNVRSMRVRLTQSNEGANS